MTARLVQIVTGLSLVVGIVVGIINLERGERHRRLAALEHIQRIITVDTEVQRDILKLDLKNLRYAELAREGLVPGTPPRTGRDLYFSDRLAPFFKIGQHYEQMGAMVKRDYIDFDLLFDVIAFPDEFWVQSAPLRRDLAANWRGPGDGLKDLWDNFAYLCERYQKARRAIGARTIAC